MQYNIHKQVKKGKYGKHCLSYPSEGRNAQSITDVKTCPAAAVTCCAGVVHNLELAPDQLGGIVHGAAMKQLE